MTTADREKWDAKYATLSQPAAIVPDPWIAEQAAFLRPGFALDLACGLGHNALGLAQQGWNVTAVDVSHVGLQRAAELGNRHGLSVAWTRADLDSWTPEPDAYDLVVVTRFLDRQRLPTLIHAALRAGGTLLYETFVQLPELTAPQQPRDPAFVLQPGELPQFFPEFECREFTEFERNNSGCARFAGRKRLV